jgi:hypothetical protein
MGIPYDVDGGADGCDVVAADFGGRAS